MKNIAVILAGGIGKRMGSTSTPKQYLTIGNKPIIVHTIEKFYYHPQIDSVLVLVPKDWINYTERLVKKYIPEEEKNINIICGGKERSETLYIGSKHCLEKYNEDVNIISHDAVRPFVTYEVISDNIQKLKKYMAVDTTIPSDDTIVEIDSAKEVVSNIPVRRKMHLGQTPQSFSANDYVNIYEDLTIDELKDITDACKMFVENGFSVGYVLGSKSNFKITTNFDLKIAEITVKVSE